MVLEAKEVLVAAPDGGGSAGGSSMLPSAPALSSSSSNIRLVKPFHDNFQGYKGYINVITRYLDTAARTHKHPILSIMYHIIFYNIYLIFRTVFFWLGITGYCRGGFRHILKGEGGK